MFPNRALIMLTHAKIDIRAKIRHCHHNRIMVLTRYFQRLEHNSILIQCSNAFVHNHILSIFDISACPRIDIS